MKNRRLSLVFLFVLGLAAAAFAISRGYGLSTTGSGLDHVVSGY